MKVWIDTDSGTWGTLEGSLVTVDLEHVAEIDGPEVDEYSLLAFLEGGSDEEIARFGKDNGVAVEHVDEPVLTVRVISPEELDTDSWTVMGDLHELVGSERDDRWHRMADAAGKDSANYAVVPWFEKTYPGVALDPEFSCFFAYPADEVSAYEIAEALNNKEFLNEW